jgi:tetrahydromethanopterin S-methyltransferase subunit G
MEAVVAEKEEAGMTQGNDGRLDELGNRVGYLSGRVDEMSKRIDDLGDRVDRGFAQVDQAFAQIRGDISALHRLLIRVSVGGAVGLGIALIGAIAT